MYMFLGWTPLHNASRYGHKETVEKLLEHPDIDVNATDHKGLTAIHLAADNKHPATVQLLLKKGAKQTVAEAGVTPLFVATYRGNLDIVKILLKAGGEEHLDVVGSIPDQFLNLPPLLAAAGFGEEAVVLYILNEYVKHHSNIL